MTNLRRLAVLLGALLPAALTAPTPAEGLAAREVVPNKYIVRLKDSAGFDSHLSWVNEVHKRSLSRRDLGGVEKEYHIGSFEAYSGEFDEETIAEIKNNPEVSAMQRAEPCGVDVMAVG